MYLDRIDAVVRRILPDPLLVAGDFNAKSSVWGSHRQDARSGTLRDWTESLGLSVIQEGRASLCDLCAPIESVDRGRYVRLPMGCTKSR